MTGEIEFAHIVFRDDTARFYTVPISDVKYKKNSRNHIAPTNADDFNKRQVYYAAWRDCDEQCEEDHPHIEYYPAFVLLLGETAEQIQTKVDEGRRLIIPNMVESSESEEIDKKKKTKRTTLMQNVQRNKNEEIMEKFKSRGFLSSRKTLGESGDESDVDSTIPEITETDEHETAAKDNRKKNDKEYDHASVTETETLENQKVHLKKIMEQRNKIINELQENQNGKSKMKRVTVRKNLFGGGDNANAKENANDDHRTGKASIQRVQKVKMTVFSKRAGIEEENEPGRPGCSGTSALSASSTCIRHTNLDPENQIASKQVAMTPQRISHEHFQNDDNDRHLMEGANNDDEDEGHEEQVGRVRLGPKIKKRNTNNVAVGLSRKIIKEINEALQFYEGQELDERGRKRYTVTDDRIYLGEGIDVSANTWFLIRQDKPTVFFRSMIELLWGQRRLLNRCQNPFKVTTKLLDRSPMKVLTPQKKRLAYKLYSDFLDTKGITEGDKMKLMKKVPVLFTNKISYLRAKYYK